MKYVIGNWKMHLSVRESIALSRGILRFLRGVENNPEVVLCPPFTSLGEVNKVLARSKVALGAQNCGPEKAGAFTGEVAVNMLEDAGCSFVIVGHSERRAIGESDASIKNRLEIAYQSKLTPIFCVGENKKVREDGQAFEFVLKQLQSALEDLKISRNQKVIVAYEPIWAIGTGISATPGDAVEMHARIRTAVERLTGMPSENIVVLYGGSVDAENAYEFLRESEVDGVLVGGASIKLQEFKGIIEAARDVITAQSTV